QLPYYIDGENKVTQSNAVLRYIARKNGLVAKTDAEKMRVDILENEAMDIMRGWRMLCKNPDFVGNSSLLLFFFLDLK
ncbi:UNVERIFIED_CONTAM: hypothetical protein GTU68_048617, partial [Idotea baltica]|nr:hypothetical protein [Idotea baltica]